MYKLKVTNGRHTPTLEEDGKGGFYLLVDSFYVLHFTSTGKMYTCPGVSEEETGLSVDYRGNVTCDGED